MRLSEIGYKEIIDFSTCRKYGQLWDSELLFDPVTGKISAILISDYKGKNINPDDYRKLPWSSILKVGDDLIIFKTGD